MRWTMVLPLVLSASTLAVHSRPQASEMTEARKAELRALVVEDCGACHGARLKGGLGPSLLPERLAPLPDAMLVDTILNGRDGTPMPPWRSFLTPVEARWIVHGLKAGDFLR